MVLRDWDIIGFLISLSKCLNLNQKLPKKRSAQFRTRCGATKSSATPNSVILLTNLRPLNVASTLQLKLTKGGELGL